jgi:transmembrane sensor
MKNEFTINDDLIVKYLCGEASPEEALSVEHWRLVSSENNIYFEQMQQTHQLAYDRKIHIPNKNLAWQTLEKAIQPKQSYKQIWMGLAAVLVGGLLLVFTIINLSEKSIQIIANKENKQTILNDKSTVDIMPNSKIILLEGFGKTNRTLQLEGKADFRVEHEGSHPFIVKADDVFIEDIGTAFTVENQTESDTIYVVVNEGIVRLYDEHGHELIIKAGEKAWYIKSEKKIIADINTKVLKFDFKNTKLSDVVKILEENYEISVELIPQKIGDCTITTQFFDEEVATIINVIAQSTGFKYQYQNNQYKIEGKPCQ